MHRVAQGKFALMERARSNVVGLLEFRVRRGPFALMFQTTTVIRTMVVPTVLECALRLFAWIKRVRRAIRVSMACARKRVVGFWGFHVPKDKFAKTSQEIPAAPAQTVWAFAIHRLARDEQFNRSVPLLAETVGLMRRVLGITANWVVQKRPIATQQMRLLEIGCAAKAAMLAACAKKSVMFASSCTCPCARVRIKPSPTRVLQKWLAFLQTRTIKESAMGEVRKARDLTATFGSIILVAMSKFCI